MPTSGTYAYSPEIAEFVDEAFERCVIDPAGLTVRQVRSARRSLNLLFAEWATRGAHLFAVDEQTQTLTDGLAYYTAATGTLAFLEIVVRRSGIDTPVTRIDREMYHMIPDKTVEGLPSQLFFNRALGQYWLWNVPENSTDVLRYYRLRRLQDVTAAGETPDVPYHWYEALASGLAAKLAGKFAKPLEDGLVSTADRRFKEAKEEDRERVDTAVTVQLW